MQVPCLLVMTQPSSIQSKSDMEDTSKLSKSQKKRRKKKAGKEGGTAVSNSEQESKRGADSFVVTASVASGATLNPSTKVRDRLVAEGFTTKEVETAMSEMWDKEMTGYDEFDAVLAYLKKTTEAQDESTAPSTAPSMSMDEPSLNGHHFVEAVEESKEEEIEDASISTASSQHMDMAARLDIVAESEDLGDSAFALNKWISEMAKQSELEGFCSGNKSRALFTVIRRSIEEPSASSLPAVLTMVSSVFIKAGMDSLSASEMKGNLKLVLQQARTAYSKNKLDQGSLAESFGNAIVTRISGLVHDLMSQENDDASKSIRHLEKEIDSLSTSLNSLEQCGIAKLVQNRDVQKQAADKASIVVNIVLGSVPSGDGTAVQVSAVTKDEVLLSLVGSEGVKKMNANKAAHDAVRQKMKDAESRSSPEYQALKMNLSAFQGERSIVADKIAELKNALKKLEEEDAVLCQKIEGTERDIAALDEDCNGEIAKLREELAITSKAAESDVSVRALADRLAVYETSVKKSVNAASFASNGSEDMSNLVPEKMNLYLIRARNYFRSEADCVQFLRSRVRTLENEANSLNNELEEFMSLGLSTNARQVQHTLQQKVQNIQEDNQAIEKLCEEAAKTRDEIADKLEKLGGLSSMHVSVLHGIASNIAELELEMGGLSQYVESNGYASKAPPATDGSRSAPKAKEQDATPAQLASKLTWATNGEAKKTEAKSLLHIQKEEELLTKK